MKNVFLLLLISSLGFTNIDDLNAQQSTANTYDYTDTNTAIRYSLYIKTTGNQVEIWTNSSADNKWQKAKITYSNDEVIRYQVAYRNWKYELRIHPTGDNAILVRNTMTNSKELTYYKRVD